MGADSSMSIYFSEFILNGIYCFCTFQGSSSEMRYFNVGMECFIVGIYKFRNTCQKYGRTAKASELFCVDISFFFKEHVQYTD